MEKCCAAQWYNIILPHVTQLSPSLGVGRSAVRGHDRLVPGQQPGPGGRYPQVSAAVRPAGPRQEHEQGHLPPDHRRVGLHLAGALQELDL